MFFYFFLLLHHLCWTVEIYFNLCTLVLFYFLLIVFFSFFIICFCSYSYVIFFLLPDRGNAARRRQSERINRHITSRGQMIYYILGSWSEAIFCFTSDHECISGLSIYSSCLSLSVYICLYLSISIYLSIAPVCHYLSLSLSVYIYIYIYLSLSLYIYICIYLAIYL